MRVGHGYGAGAAGKLIIIRLPGESRDPWERTGTPQRFVDDLVSPGFRREDDCQRKSGFSHPAASSSVSRFTGVMRIAVT